MRTTSKLTFAFLLLTVILSTLAVTYGQSDAISAAQEANNNAYTAILDAYNAGADTNQLIEQLNQAVNLTTQAQQLTSTDPQQADSLASQAQTIAQDVTLQATTAQQVAANSLPIIPIAIAASLVVIGIIVFALGPKALWAVWFKLRRNHRITIRNPTSKERGLVVTAESVCALILGVTVLLAFLSVSGFLLPQNQGEQFSELGILGPNMKLADYPSVAVTTDSIHLYGYVGNEMGRPMYYTVMVKLGDNFTAVNPSPIDPVKQFSQVVPSNQTWTFPVDLTMTKAGDNQRIIFELWIYNATTNQNQYHERWGQVWLNVTSPAI